MKIDLHGQAGLPYINRGVYTGSFCGMRYRMSKETRTRGEEEEKVLALAIYPEPLCFECTPEEKKEYQDFPFTEEGFAQAVAYLNECYEARQGELEEALKNRFK